MSKTNCPYCQVLLDPIPKRKKACPKCGQVIMIRQGELITEENAYISDWLIHLHIDRVKFDEYRKQLSEKFKNQASINDTFWEILNRTADYMNMARLARIEKKDPVPYIRAGQKTELEEYKAQGVKLVIVMGMNDNFVCDKCKELANKKVSVDKLLNQIPADNCTCVIGCRCFFSAIY
jgi:competence CoiA-like predicted nuclease